MVISKNGNVRITGTGIEIVADIGAALSSLLDSIYDSGIAEETARNLVNDVVKSAFELSKYKKSSDNMDDELNMIDAFNKALDEVENKFRRKNVKRDL